MKAQWRISICVDQATASGLRAAKEPRKKSFHQSFFKKKLNQAYRRLIASGDPQKRVSHVDSILLGERGRRALFFIRSRVHCFLSSYDPSSVRCRNVLLDPSLLHLDSVCSVNTLNLLEPLLLPSRRDSRSQKIEAK